MAEDMIITYHKLAVHLDATRIVGDSMVARVSEYLNYAEQPLARHKFVQFTLQDGTLVPAQHAHKHALLQPVSMTVSNNQKQKIMTRMSTVADICSPPDGERIHTATYPRCGRLPHTRAQNPRNHFLRSPRRIGHLRRPN